MLNEQQFYSHPYGECSMVRFERLQISSYTQRLSIYYRIKDCYNIALINARAWSSLVGGEET